jgi:hypothetical protein
MEAMTDGLARQPFGSSPPPPYAKEEGSVGLWRIGWDPFAAGISFVADSVAKFNGSARDILADHQTNPVFCADWMSHPFPRGRVGCIAYVCQDLFPHIC